MSREKEIPSSVEARDQDLPFATQQDHEQALLRKFAEEHRGWKHTVIALSLATSVVAKSIENAEAGESAQEPTQIAMVETSVAAEKVPPQELQLETLETIKELSAREKGNLLKAVRKVDLENLETTHDLLNELFEELKSLKSVEEIRVLVQKAQVAIKETPRWKLLTKPEELENKLKQIWQEA